MNITSPTTADRLAARLKEDPETGCLIWTGSLISNGYGHIYIGHKGNPRPTHKVAWVLRHGPIPDGKWVLHECDRPTCCNVDHLFLGTKFDNAADMISKGRGNNQKKTHCPKGHPYSEENTIHYVDQSGRKSRFCKACRYENTASYRAEQRLIRRLYQEDYEP